MPIECCNQKLKYRIPLGLFLQMQQNDDSIDCYDTEIDNVICVETEVYRDEEFPLMEQCIRKLYDLVDVVAMDPVIVDISGLLHHNINVVKEWVKDNWRPEYVGLLDEDDGEWENQFIESFNALLAGNYGEKSHARYLKLFEQFQRVPAQPDEMVLVPAHDTVVYIEGKVVNGPQNGGIK